MSAYNEKTKQYLTQQILQLFRQPHLITGKGKCIQIKTAQRTLFVPRDRYFGFEDALGG